MAHLIHDHSLLAAIRQETAPVVSSSASPADLAAKLKSCAKLNSLYHEVLRYTSAVSSSRTCLAETTLGGRTIRPGTDVIVAGRELLMDEDTFGIDAQKFQWDRFLQNNELLRSPAYSVFGGGNGSCAGRLLAHAQVLSFVALALTRFDFEVVEPGGLPNLDTKTPGQVLMGPVAGQDVRMHVKSR